MPKVQVSSSSHFHRDDWWFPYSSGDWLSVLKVVTQGEQHLWCQKKLSTSLLCLSGPDMLSLASMMIFWPPSMTMTLFSNHTHKPMSHHQLLSLTRFHHHFHDLKCPSRSPQNCLPDLVSSVSEWTWWQPDAFIIYLLGFHIWTHKNPTLLCYFINCQNIDLTSSNHSLGQCRRCPLRQWPSWMSITFSQLLTTFKNT